MAACAVGTTLTMRSQGQPLADMLLTQQAVAVSVQVTSFLQKEFCLELSDRRGCGAAPPL